MRVPLLDLSEQYRNLENEILAATRDVLSSQRFILGEKVKSFETAVATYCGISNAIGVSSGTDALLASLMALGIGPGDAVITTAYSFFGTAGSIARVGAVPLFVDIESGTYNISTKALKEFVETKCDFKDGTLTASPTAADQRRLRVRAIMPVHLFGLCCDMNAVREVAGHYNVDVIEDAAQALGAEFPTSDLGPRKAGTMGKVGCFSFYPSKNLGAAGDAGLVVCSDGNLAKRLRATRDHGMEPRYYHHFIGGNFRLDEIQAAILSVKLPHLDGWAAARRKAAEFYTNEFKEHRLSDKVICPNEPYRDSGLTNHHVYHQYVIRTTRRDDLRKFLSQREIGTAVYYPLGLHEQKCFEYLGHKSGDFPEAVRAARGTLALPIYPEISRDAQRYVVNCIAEFFG
jgi:dTDP-4-amino-4,6-dideoxygalactose transaminase